MYKESEFIADTLACVRVLIYSLIENKVLSADTLCQHFEEAIAAIEKGGTKLPKESPLIHMIAFLRDFDLVDPKRLVAGIHSKK